MYFLSDSRNNDMSAICQRFVICPGRRASFSQSFHFSDWGQANIIGPVIKKDLTIKMNVVIIVKTGPLVNSQRPIEA